MKQALFQGVCTALVTPFLNNEINYPMLEQLIHRQIRAGVKAIVIAGTTGESATLTDTEKIELLRKAKEYAQDRCIIIAGTGSNSTEHAVALSCAAEANGADALLVVSPYYNKATQDGLVAHYRAISHAVHIPVIVYNVPSRTGLDIPISVYQELSKEGNIIGVKEANPDISRILSIRSHCPEDFYIWSGNDDLTVPILSLGGQGVISVLSNIYPEMVIAMTNAAFNQNYDTAARLQIRLEPMIRALFRQVNPVPVKAAMKITGYDCGSCRLPLTDPSPLVIEELKTLLTE